MKQYFKLLKEFLMKHHPWLLPAAFVMSVAGLSLLWLGLQQTHTVTLAGDPVLVRTPAWRVSGVLRAAGITVNEDDRLIPDGDPWLWAPTEITIEPAREVHLCTPEEAVTLFTPERIPANLIAALQMPLFPQDQVLVNGVEIDPHKPLEGSGVLFVQVKPAVAVDLVVDGDRRTFFSHAPTLGAALETAQIPVFPHDWVSEALTTPLGDGLVVAIRRARRVSVRAGEHEVSG